MLAVLLLTTALPFSVSAEDAIKNDAPTSGTTGDCTWSLDIYSYTLTISGNGAMKNYSDSSSSPWSKNINIVLVLLHI